MLRRIVCFVAQDPDSVKLSVFSLNTLGGKTIVPEPISPPPLYSPPPSYQETQDVGKRRLSIKFKVITYNSSILLNISYVAFYHKYPNGFISQVT